MTGATDPGGLDLGVWVAIAAMALVTYAMRAGGYWIMGRVPLTARIQRMLAALPGSILAATVLPIVANGGAATALAVGAGALVMLVGRNDFLAVATGMAVAAAARAAGLD
ncbi:AzlD domain-containing protein [Rhodoplanes sp. TEM]|uniref:AzlD domain-containing protein n=1 Tax=Rhodoplanes tepidamans TaxID=200616 RepID=A0ABT5J5E7_RHOTP|nr:MULTISPECIES: AzlD domain-containing protein [Rhodoplanes]MDC7784857.1 AzlD domain-containing protein [Rhodoplanes tepidamans]MDC7986043.1 AzlD domain-containing protein [Rhodoplanes sp. TEM]MDQ0353916.1 putative membrane protein [Rhodoplanes tepidamans]